MQQLKYIFTILFISVFGCAFGQEKNLSIDNTLDIVRKYHPLIRQSFLRNEISKNELMASKGVFDPIIQINSQEKTFDNKQYYKYNSTELKIPIWYGIDIKAGTENNYGDRIDPTLTKNKSAFVGVSMDPFRGLLVDKRKSIINQANNIVELTKNEQLLIINDLMLDATSAYWNWVSAFYNNALLIKSVQSNKERYEVIKKSYQSGDRAPIDTTEALTQLQNFEILQTQSAVELQKARFELSNFFWTENKLPFELDETIQPVSNFEIDKIAKIEIGDLEDQIDQAAQQHPKLKMTDAKLKYLDVEKRLKFVELFPSLKLNYNALDNDLRNFSTTLNTANNFKYGLSLSMPIFQRQARGEIAKTKNKIADLNLDRKYLSLEIENKVKSSFSDFHSLKQQIKTNELVLNANKLLFDTENNKFQMGESSLFLINNRELKFIETEQKQIALKSKFYLSIYKNLWSMGKLN
jgi:outer membrane protein TolC